jgi:drug/metabolite transporter (DMT)-like permease
MALAGSALIAAESILALTPIAIKRTPLDPTSAIWSRILTSGALGYLISSEKTLTLNEIGAASLLGYINLLHISSSYEAFRNLPAGQAMSILYTYPLWNLIFNSYFNKEHFSSTDYGLMGIAATGSALLNYNPGQAVPAASGGKPQAGWGIFMALIAAITESGMHVVLKHLGWRDPAKSVWVVSSSASLWLFAYVFIHTWFDHLPYPEVYGSFKDTVWLTAFHGLSTFAGYYLRFYAVPRISTVLYSILSYSGLLASYLFGLWFLGERPGIVSILGACLILVSGLLLQMPSSKKQPASA